MSRGNGRRLLPDLALAAIQSAKLPVAFADSTERSHPLLFANEAFAALVGRAGKDLTGQSLLTLLALDRGDVDILSQALQSDEVGHIPLHAGEPGGVVLIYRPIPGHDGVRILAQPGTATELRLGWPHDPLTDLQTREALEMRLTEVLERLEARLFKIHMQDVEEITEAFGWTIGDMVVREVARRCVAAADPAALVARTGSHRFAILETGPPRQAVEDQAEGLLSLLAQPIVVGGHEFVTMPAIGIATQGLSPPAGSGVGRARELLKRADIALQEARRGHSRRAVVYSDSIDDRSANRAMLRQSLYQALARQQFELHYQPQVELSSGRVVGAEALVRWNHPTLGWQRPDVFIPLAEESGQILPLGRWVIEAAFRQARTWNKGRREPLQIAVNLSGEQLADPNFLPLVERLLRELELDPAWLEFELTESVMIDRSAEVQLTLHAIRALGIGLAIDDFGTGYASLRYLKDVPATVLKIDQTFVRNMIVDSSDISIVRSILILARKFGLKVVAEGVETRQQLEFLRRRGCAYGQGYLFSMPLRADDFEWLLRERPVLIAAHESEVGAIA